MTVNHRDSAARLLDMSDVSLTAALKDDLPIADQQHAAVLAGILTNRALVHATLAATMVSEDLRQEHNELRARWHGMRRWTTIHIAKGLLSTNLTLWKAAKQLTQDLDSADCNIDEEVTEYLKDGGHNARGAWARPGLPDDDDPWHPAVQALDAVKGVVAGHLAEMLLDGSSNAVRSWARGIAGELRRVGFDLDADIEKRVQQLAPGTPPVNPSDMPF